MQNDGTYARIDKRGKNILDSQKQFCEEAKQVDSTKQGSMERVFIPAEPVEG